MDRRSSRYKIWLRGKIPEKFAEFLSYFFHKSKRNNKRDVKINRTILSKQSFFQIIKSQKSFDINKFVRDLLENNTSASDNKNQDFLNKYASFIAYIQERRGSLNEDTIECILQMADKN